MIYLSVKGLREFFDAARNSDVGLMKFQGEGYNLMAFISASVVFINKTELALEFCKALVRYLSHRMQDPAAMIWHLDQAALAAAHLCIAAAKYHMIPTDMMLSKVHTDDNDVRFSEEVHFWSVTYSIRNAAKLDGTFFKKFLLPTKSY